jgi:hypothetical protein
VSYVDGTLAVDGKTVRLTPLLRQMGSQDSAASRAVAVSYGLTTSGSANQAVPPDGLTGLVLVDGRLWWLGPQTRPWRPEHGGVEIVGIRIALKWGHAVLGESLHGYQDARVPVNELWPLDPALDVSAGPLVETPLNRLMRVIEHRVSGKTIDPFAENAAAWLRTGGRLGEPGRTIDSSVPSTMPHLLRSSSVKAAKNQPTSSGSSTPPTGWARGVS